MLTKLLLAPLFALATLASTAAGQTTIEQIAPENSVVIVGSKKFQTVVDHVKSTPLWTLWQSEQMKKFREDAVKQMGEGIDEMLQELGVEEGSLTPPSGPLGLALFPVTDEETGMSKAAFVAIADYADAEKAQKMDALILAALARGEKDGMIEFEQNDVLGRTVYEIDLTKIQEQAKQAIDDMGMDDVGGEMPVPMPAPSDLLSQIAKLHYLRDGNALLLGSDAASLTHAVETIDGKAQAGAGLADRADYSGVLQKLGDSDFHGVLLTRDIMQLFAAADQMGMMQMMQPTMRALFGEVQGYGFGLRFDGPTAMLEESLAVHMPNGKQGLTTLLDTPIPQAPLPPFVGPDAVSYTNLNFEFAGLMDVIRGVVNSNPMLQAQGGAEVDAMAPMVNQVTSTLGTQVHWLTSVTKPFTETSRSSLLAIECTKPQEFENFFSGMAAQAGLEARDFLGQRIYSMDPEMMPMTGMPMQSFSLGLGGGYILLGETTAVEQGLRATSQAAGATLTSNSEFQRSVAALSKGNAVAWGYSDTIDAAESAVLEQRFAMERMLRQMRENMAEDADAADQDEGIDEFEAGMQEQIDQYREMIDKIDFNLLRQHIGPTAWQIQSTEDGYVGRVYLLGATAGK